MDFKNTILIMTSNLGSQFLVNEDMDADAKKKAVMDAVHMNFKPEFLNRLDDIVMFHPLTREELGGIVDIQVAGVAQRLTDRRITLDVTDSAREWLANTGYDPAYGARPLRRLVQTEVGDQLARMLLAGKVHDGDTVLVDQTGGEHLELSAWASDQIVSDDPDVSVGNVTETEVTEGSGNFETVIFSAKSLKQVGKSSLSAKLTRRGALLPARRASLYLALL